MFTFDDVQLKVKIKLDGEQTDVVNVRDPSRTVVARFTVQPGAQLPGTPCRPGGGQCCRWRADLRRGRRLRGTPIPGGTAFVDPGQGHVHTAFNDTDGVTVLVATFFSAPAEGPLLIPASPGCA